MVMRSGEDIAGDKDAKPAKPLPWKYIAIAAASILGLIAAISLFNTNPAATTTSSGWQPPPEPANPGGWIPPDEPNEPPVAITNPPEKVVKQFLKEHPDIKLYPTVLANFNREQRQWWASKVLPISDLPSEIHYRSPDPIYVVVENFKPGGKISGYVEYRGTEELFFPARPPVFGYISKYSTNPIGNSDILIFHCEFGVRQIKGEEITTCYYHGFRQHTKWVDPSIDRNKQGQLYRFSPGEKLYFKSIPKEEQTRKLFSQQVTKADYEAALREQAQWVYLTQKN